MSAAVSVIFQSLANVWVAIPAFILHLGGFLVLFPLALRLLAKGQHLLSEGSAFDRVHFETDGIVGELGHTGEQVPLQLLGVERFWGAIRVKLKPVDHDPEKPAREVADPLAITVWKSVVGQEKFRKIAIITHWHARRLT